MRTFVRVGREYRGINKHDLYMENKEKELYESPVMIVLEVKTETAILQASKQDYIPEEW